MIPWLILCVWASRAAFHLAHFKQRPDKARAWAVWGFLMPLGLPFLTMWRLKSKQPSPRSWSALMVIAFGNFVIIWQGMALTIVALTWGNLVGPPACLSQFAIHELGTSFPRPTPQEGNAT